MSFLDRIAGFSPFSRRFSSHKRLYAMTIEELRLEHIRAEQSERRLMKEIDKLESDKDELFRRGAMETSSNRQKQQIARKIKQLDNQIKGKDKALSLLAKELRLLSSISQIKENERVFSELGLSSILRDLNDVDLQRYIEQATVRGEFQMDAFSRVLEAIDDAESLAPNEDGDDEIAGIVAAMTQAGQAQDEASYAAYVRHMQSMLDHGCEVEKTSGAPMNQEPLNQTGR